MGFGFDSFWDSCNALGLEYNSLPWNPAPHDLLIPRDHLYVKCWSPDTAEAETFPAVPSRGAHGTVQMDFSDESCQLQDDNTLSWTPPQWVFLPRTRQNLASLPLSLRLPRPCNLMPENHHSRATQASSSPLGHSLTAPSLAHILQSTHLKARICNKAARIPESSVPTTCVYTDVSSSP